MTVTSARISGVNIPLNKKLYVSLSYIFGIGRNVGSIICSKLAISPDARVKDLTEDDLTKIRKYIDENLKVEGNLRADVGNNIKMKISIGSYQGSRHRLKLPVHGQRTKTNARTRKGKGAAVAGKKKIAK